MAYETLSGHWSAMSRTSMMKDYAAISWVA